MLGKHIGVSLVVLAVAIIAALILFNNVPPAEEESQSVSDVPKIDPLVEGIAVFPTWDVLAPASFPLLVDGEAPGPWYFEASFSLEVRLPDGTIVGQGFSTAQSDWMTEGTVPFFAEVQLIENVPSYTGEASLILRRANASGLPEHDRAFSIPILISIE